MEYAKLIAYIAFFIFSGTIFAYNAVYFCRVNGSARRLGIETEGFMNKALKINVMASFSLAALTGLYLVRLLIS